jgi:pteridine reductase
LHYHTSEHDARVLRDELETLRPGSVRLFKADLRDTTAIEEMVRSVADAFTRVDVLVNNASSFFATPIGSIEESAWNELLDVNLKAPLFLSQAAAPRLRESRGCIINIADIYATVPLVGYAAYTAAKAGLVMLTRTLALELAPHVRVNGVAPGAILWPSSDPGEDTRAAVLAKIPLGHIGDPADIGQTVLFLVRNADYVTGQVIKVDGGRAIG